MESAGSHGIYKINFVPYETVVMSGCTLFIENYLQVFIPVQIIQKTLINYFYFCSRSVYNYFEPFFEDLKFTNNVLYMGQWAY